jgi:hypothetical protein
MINDLTNILKSLNSGSISNIPEVMDYINQSNATNKVAQYNPTNTGGAIGNLIATYVQSKRQKKAEEGLYSALKEQQNKDETRRLGLVAALPEQERELGRHLNLAALEENVAKRLAPSTRGSAQLDYITELSNNPKLLKIAKDLRLVNQGVEFDPNTNSVLQTSGYAPARAEIEGAISGAKQEAKNISDIGSAGPKKENAELGRARAQAKINLPVIEDAATYTLDLVNQLENHPGLSKVVGHYDLTKPITTALSQDARDFEILREQVNSKAFLDAFEKLKGGGSITEKEGEKGTEAIARMKTTQSEKQFRMALREFTEIVERGRTRARNATKMNIGVKNESSGIPETSQLFPEQKNSQVRRRKFNPATGRIE